jgi:hypothetical protein
MNAGRDVQQLIATWLDEEAPARAPDRILDVAAHRIDRTKQQRLPAAWREPMIISMGRLAAAAAIFLVAVVGAGWIGRVSAPAGGTAVPTPVTTSTPTLSPHTFESYATARNDVCRGAAEQLNPLKPRFLGIWDGSITPAQRADWVAGLRQFASGYDDMLARLDQLNPPSDTAKDHAINLGQFRAETSMIRAVASDLEANLDAQAQGVDQATDPISSSIASWEQRMGLSPCP